MGRARNRKLTRKLTRKLRDKDSPSPQLPALTYQEFQQARQVVRADLQWVEMPPALVQVMAEMQALTVRRRAMAPAIPQPKTPRTKPRRYLLLLPSRRQE